AGGGGGRGGGWEQGGRTPHRYRVRRGPRLGDRELGTEHGPPRPGQEAGLEQQRVDRRLRDGLAVEALDREPLRAAVLHVLDERGERGAQPLVLGLAQRDERPPTALHEQRRLAAE